MKTFPESYYHDPSLGGAQELGHIEWKEKAKKERKQYRKEHGCGGCCHSEPMLGVYACGIGETPGQAGYCGEWWDIRAKKKPGEV